MCCLMTGAASCNACEYCLNTMPHLAPRCRCTTSGKWRVPGKADAWMLPGVGHRVFDGLRIFLSGESATLETLRRILPYAGGLFES